MVNNIIGFMLIDAPYSALNNAGNDAGDRTDNIVKVKSIDKYTSDGKKTYPYVSGQALRYWWRDTLEKQFNWELSPIEREKKIAYTKADPITFPDDDVFGYMRALKKKEGGTVTRISPLKNSPLISVVSQNPTRDFGVMSRQKEGDPVPFEHEFYSTILKGIFSLDISNLGMFSEVEKTGYRNMYPALVKKAESEKLDYDEDKNLWSLNKEERVKRASDVIKALPYLSGGAKNTSHLTDVSPNLLILTSISTGNNIFMNIVYEDKNELTFDINALNEVLADYEDKLTSPIYIGMRKGFLPELYSELENINNDKIIFGSIKEITDKFTESINELI